MEMLGALTSSRPPLFVKNHYNTVSLVSLYWSKNEFAIAHLLWDGKLCCQHEGPCCRSSLLSWFHKSVGGITANNRN